MASSRYCVIGSLLGLSLHHPILRAKTEAVCVVMIKVPVCLCNQRPVATQRRLLHPAEPVRRIVPVLRALKRLVLLGVQRSYPRLYLGRILPARLERSSQRLAGLGGGRGGR